MIFTGSYLINATMVALVYAYWS